MAKMTNEEMVAMAILEKYVLNWNVIYLMLWSLLT